ncbi:hypothetical protein [Actinophytocola sediminis]
MATSEEIRQRVEEADTTRSARRAAAAQRVGELARRRAVIVDQLAAVERELGDILVDAQDVIDVDELAGFTDLKPSDLSGWLAGRKATRGGRRRKTTTASAEQGDTRRTPGPKPSVSERGADSRVSLTSAGAGAPERPVAQTS